LDGSLALAIPTQLGQHLKTKQTRKSDLYWKSYDQNGAEWFSAQISLMDFSAVKTSNKEMAQYLQKLLKAAVRLNSEFLSVWNGFDVKTYLEFPLNWGLGSSSSLTYCVAQWADVNPLLLHFGVSNGSGYDVACAGVELPLQYQLEDETINYTEIDFSPSFSDKIFFVHLNEKASSKNAVDFYFKNAQKKKTMVKRLTEITESIINTNTLDKFCTLIEEHENVVSEHLGLEKIKDKLFSDFNGSIKSLGAWGGDFIMAVSKNGPDAVKSYFSTKGYATVIPYDQMILKDQESTILSEV
jgi:mevalonate kinase